MYDHQPRGEEGSPTLRHPAVSEKHVAFIHGGDVWVADKATALSASGADAYRLTAAAGQEIGPRFSPDGQWIAYTGDHHSTVDIYTIPVGGGEPRRLTHHPWEDRIIGWVDGKILGSEGFWVLFASQMRSGTRRWQLYGVPAIGGVPRRFPLSIAQYGDISSLGWLAFQKVVD